MSSEVADLVSPAQYREQRPHLYQSEGSMQWYLRENRDALIERGALLMHAGRWYIKPSTFDAYVVEAGKAAAKRHLAVA